MGRVILSIAIVVIGVTGTFSPETIAKAKAEAKECYEGGLTAFRNNLRAFWCNKRNSCSKE